MNARSAIFALLLVALSRQVTLAAPLAVIEDRTLSFADASGSYRVVFSGREVVPQPPDAKLYSAIEVHLVDGKLKDVLSVRDAAGAGEAGVGFLRAQSEVTDLDGDGLVDPIFAYRLFTLGDDGAPRFGAYAGRIKIVLLYKKQKVVIRAKTGELDGERATTATPNYFALPKVVQDHLVGKMRAMYESDEFGFDNSYAFAPRKER